MPNVVDGRREYGVDPEIIDFDLSAQLAALARHRLWLVVGALVGLTFAGVYAATAPRVYDASAKLLITASKLGTNANVSSATFRSLVENQSVGAEVIRELNLSGMTDMNPSTFVGDHVTVSVVRDANILLVEAHMPTADLAARTANAMARGGVQLTKRLNGEELQASDDLVQAAMVKAEARLSQAQNALQTRRALARVELLNNDIGSFMAQRTELASLLVQLPDEEARLAAAEKELAAQPKVRSERRAIDLSLEPSPTSPASSPPTFSPPTPLPHTAVAATPAQPTVASEPEPTPMRLRPEATDPYVNPVYETLQAEVATRRARIAGLQRRRAQLMNVLKVNSDRPSALQRLYQEQTEIDRLQVEFDAAKKAYSDIAATYELTKLQVSGRSAAVQLLDPAVPPMRPSSPRPLRLIAAGLAGGFGLAAIAVLLIAGRAHGKRAR